MPSGSLVNSIIGGNGQKDPEVGMPATVCHWSDRSPAEVAEVLRFKSGERKGQIRGVRVRSMKSILISGSMHNGSAEYRYESDPDAPLSGIYFRNEHGGYQRPNKGSRLSLGRAEKYYDPHF